MTPTATTARATQRYLGWGRLASGLAFAASLMAGVISGATWYLVLIATGSVLLVAVGLATSTSGLRRRGGDVALDGLEIVVFGVLLAGGLDEQTAYVAIVGLLMLVLAGLRGRHALRTSAAVAVAAETCRQVLGRLLVGETIDLEESLVGLGLAAVVGMVVAGMVDLARASEQAARESEASASAALAEAERAIAQLEAMHRVVASGIGEHEDETLQRIVEEIAASVGLPYVSAVLLDPSSGRPRISATTEPDVRDRDDIDPLAPGPFTTGPLARALEGRPTRPTEQELAQHARSATPRGDGVVHPLTRPDGTVIGALVSSVPPGERIDEHTSRTLGQLAGQTSLAIASARALRRESELAERYRDLDRMKTDFIAITSHELRTPLTTIGGAVEVLHERADDLAPEDVHRLLAALRRQTRRLVRLVDDLRTVSLVDAGTLAIHPRPTDVGRTVRDAVGTLADIDTRVTIAPRLPRVVADPDRLTQVLSNLLVNGDQHGVAPVHVDVAGDEDTGVTLEVWDEGPGIPAPHRARVFERFSRLGETNTHSRGSGLGLFIVRQLIEAMDGTIDVVDHPGGSAFRVWLPACPNDH